MSNVVLDLYHRAATTKTRMKLNPQDGFVVFPATISKVHDPSLVKRQRITSLVSVDTVIA